MKYLILTGMCLMVSGVSLANTKNCETRAVVRAMQEYQKNGLSDPYFVSDYKIIGKKVDGNSLFTAIRISDSITSTTYTVEQNINNCRVIKVR